MIRPWNWRTPPSPSSPGDRQIATVSAVAADNAGKLDLAKTRYEEVLAKWSDDAISANNLAALIADNWASDRALVDRARKLAERFRNSDNPILLDTLGWVLIRQGNFDDGTVILERAASALPSNQQIQFHYAAALSAKRTQGESARGICKGSGGQSELSRCRRGPAALIGAELALPIASAGAKEPLLEWLLLSPKAFSATDVLIRTRDRLAGQPRRRRLAAGCSC